MRIRFLFVGKSDEAEYARGVERYVARIARFSPCDVVVVKEEKPGAKADAERVKAKEGERLLAALQPRDLLVLCDERGKERTSAEFARDLRGWLDSGPSAVAFAVGGAFGLDPSLTPRARAILSLSRMTLPHQMARLLLAEQVYRATATLSGVAYSK
ncbi:MAG: 23S rRNA (pseudouridine(1915)-N(3))-methyltransferase RlmH [Acidobacteria bacterium]|nr:23S rRNA (pseudouridine(1915)-N(3))-methyltransferase RlmH [Acidobacteriota bacterium]